jgi:hypothetical protein
MSRVLALAALLAATPLLADEAPRRVAIPDSALQAPGLVNPLPAPVARPDVRPVPAPIAEREEPKQPAPETALWLAHLNMNAQRRIPRGGELGGVGLIGLRLGGKGDATPDRFAPEVLASLESWNDDGALILAVTPDAPADAAGLEAGDVIVRYAGLWVDSMHSLIRLVSRAEPGEEHEVWFLRNGQVLSTYVMTADRDEILKVQPAQP